MLVLPEATAICNKLTGWDLNDLLFSRGGIVLVMTFKISSRWSILPFPAALLASSQRLAIVARSRRQRLAGLLAYYAAD